MFFMVNCNSKCDKIQILDQSRYFASTQQLLVWESYMPGFFLG